MDCLSLVLSQLLEHSPSPSGYVGGMSRLWHGGYSTRNVIDVFVQMSSPTPQFLSNTEMFIPRGWVRQTTTREPHIKTVQ